jgi:hypothetical protein
LVNSDGQVLGLVFGSNIDSDVGYALTNSELQDAIDFSNDWEKTDGVAETGSCQLRE